MFPPRVSDAYVNGNRAASKESAKEMWGKGGAVKGMGRNNFSFVSFTTIFWLTVFFFK